MGVVVRPIGSLLERLVVTDTLRDALRVVSLHRSVESAPGHTRWAGGFPRPRSRVFGERVHRSVTHSQGYTLWGQENTQHSIGRMSARTGVEQVQRGASSNRACWAKPGPHGHQPANGHYCPFAPRVHLHTLHGATTCPAGSALTWRSSVGGCAVCCFYSACSAGQTCPASGFCVGVP